MKQEPTTHSSATHGSEPLAGAYFGLLAFLVVYCGRPEDWIAELQVVPLAKITGAFALAALALSLGQARRLPGEMIYLSLLFAQLCLTVPFSPVYRGGAFNFVLEFSKVVAIVLVVVLAVSTLARLRWLIFTQTTCVLAITVASLVKGHLLLGRLEGASRGIYANPNDLAFAIALTIPFCFAFMLRARDGLRKAAWFLAAGVMAYTLFLTASRGGLVALVVTMGVVLKEFAVKGGRRYLLILAGLVVLTVSLLAGGGLMKRFEGLSGPSLKSAAEVGAHGSAIARGQLLWRSLVVTAQHPLLGIGPGNFPIVAGWHVAHNSFTEMSAEGGLPALILFILLLRRAFQNVRKVQLLAPGQSEEMLLAVALRASLAGFVAGAFFASVEYHLFAYFLVAYTSALYAIAAKHASQAQSPQRTTEAPPERQDQREDRGDTITWDDYQRGRALSSAGRLGER